MNVEPDLKSLGVQALQDDKRFPFHWEEASNIVGDLRYFKVLEVEWID